MESFEEFFKEMAYPESFNWDEFRALRTPTSRIKYAKQHLKFIASGSARAVFKVDEEKVLKIAKNEKGVAQNTVELDWVMQKYDIVAKIFEADWDDNEWMEMELARKAKASDFKKLLGVTLKEVKMFAEYKWNIASNWNPPTEEEKEIFNKLIEENEFFQDLEVIAGTWDLAFGDLGRQNSYGVVKRGGKDALVLVDFGATNDVIAQYYKI